MSENNGTFDLSGVFQVQQNYLTDLSNSYPNVNNGPVIAKYMLDLQNIDIDDIGLENNIDLGSGLLENLEIDLDIDTVNKNVNI
jgi:hypothetical protein